MTSLCVWAVLLFAGSVISASTPTRIVGGDPTSIDRYPSIVQVEFRGIFSGIWSQSCAANILTSRWVLSAAHCFEGMLYSPENRRIRAGTTFRNTGGSIVNVLHEINHPSYGQRGFDGDICIVQLVSALSYNPVIQPGTIIGHGLQLNDNSPVVHAGWGATSQGGSASSQLLDVTIYTVNNRLCAARYLTLPSRPEVTENMICAGILDVGGRDACQGDSGGPLYYYLPQDDLNLIVGVVSWGQGCANATFPGVSTAVSSYTNWIVDNAV